MRPDEHRSANRRAELHVVPCLRQRIVRDGRQVIALAILSRENAKYAGQRTRSTCVDTNDAGVWMGRANHRRIGLIRERKIVCELPVTGQQPRVFLADDRITDNAGRLIGVGHKWPCYRDAGANALTSPASNAAAATTRSPEKQRAGPPSRSSRARMVSCPL
jgi:hypothetical protein